MQREQHSSKRLFTCDYCDYLLAMIARPPCDRVPRLPGAHTSAVCRVGRHRRAPALLPAGVLPPGAAIAIAPPAYACLHWADFQCGLPLHSGRRSLKSCGPTLAGLPAPAQPYQKQPQTTFLVPAVLQVSRAGCFRGRAAQLPREPGPAPRAAEAQAQPGGRRGASQQQQAQAWCGGEPADGYALKAVGQPAAQREGAAGR